MRAVVVTDTLDWKLHGLDLMTDHQATGDLPLMSASWMVGTQYKPSEIAKSDWGAIQQGPPWAVDSWGVGCLMQVSVTNTIWQLSLISVHLSTCTYLLCLGIGFLREQTVNAGSNKL